MKRPFAAILLGLLVAGAVRGCEIALARPGDGVLVVLPDPAESDVDVRLVRDDDGFRVARLRGDVNEEAAPGGGVRLRLPAGTIDLVPAADRAPGRTVLEVPWSVVARWYGARGLHRGWRRLDLGSDPHGGEDGKGVKDLILVDPDAVSRSLAPADLEDWRASRGVARIRPADGEEFRLQDRSWQVEPEIPGLARVRGAERVALDVGRTVPLLPGDVLEVPGARLQFLLGERTVSKQGPTGWVLVRRTFLSVVEVGAPAEGGASRVVWAPDGDDLHVYDVPPGGDVRFVGTDRLLGRLSPGPLPPAWTDREFVAAARSAFASGLVREERGLLHLSEEATGEVARSTRERLASVLDRYNARRVPARFGAAFEDARGDGIDISATAWESRRDDGPWTPAVAAPAPEATHGLAGLWYPETWDPLAYPAGGVAIREFRTPVPAGATALVVAATGPLEVRFDGGLIATEDDGGRTVVPSGARTVELSLRIALPGGEPQSAPAVRLAIRSPSPVRVTEVRAAPGDAGSAFDGDLSGWPMAVSRGGWLSMPGDAVDVPGLDEEDDWIEPPPGTDPVVPHAPGPRRFLLQVESERAAAASLEWVASGEVARVAVGHGVAVEREAVAVDTGRSGGAAAGSALVPLRAGVNTVEIAVRPALLPGPTGDPEVRLSDGVPVGVRASSQVVPRPRGHRATVRLTDRDGTGTPALVVAEAAGALETGDRVRLAERPGASGLVLLDPTGEPGSLATLGDGTTLAWTGREVRLVAKTAGTLWLHDGAPPIVRGGDPAPPRAPPPPHSIRLGRNQLGLLAHDGDAAVVGPRRVTLHRGGAAASSGDIQLVSGSTVSGSDAIRIVIDGDWEPAPRPAALALHVAPDGVRVAGGGVRIFRAGEGEVPGYGALRVGDRLVLGELALRYEEPTALDGRPGLGLDDVLARPGTGLGSLFRESGPSVRLTLDDDLQEAVREALVRGVGDAGSGGSVVVLDALTGEILAAATATEAMADDRPLPEWQDLRVHPGSTFKPVTAAALARSEDPTARAMVNGDLPAAFGRTGGARLRGMELPALHAAEEPIALRTPLRNHGGGGVAAGTDLVAALAASKNTWFAYGSLLLHVPTRDRWRTGGLPMGIASRERAADAWPLLAMAEAMGFNRVFDLDGSGLATGRQAPVFDAAGRMRAPGDVLWAIPGQFPTGALVEAEVATAGIGQGDVLATPLMAAMVQAVFASGGVRPTPVLVGPPREGVRVLGPREPALVAVRRGLRRVVDDGTAGGAFRGSPWRDSVYGKTGTAERPGGDDDAWFAGWVDPPDARPGSSDPAHHPIAFAVLMPRGGLASRSAAPVAADVVDAIARSEGW